VLKYGFAKAKFTANVIFLQTLAVPAAQAAKADVLKEQQHLAVVVTKEAANAAVNAEAATEKVETIAEGQVLRVVLTNVVAEAARVDQHAQADQVQAVAVRVEIAQAVRERDRQADRRCEIGDVRNILSIIKGFAER
jgi:hypothetical protein